MRGKNKMKQDTGVRRIHDDHDPVQTGDEQDDPGRVPCPVSRIRPFQVEKTNLISAFPACIRQ
jgi:hypothetical protein